MVQKFDYGLCFALWAILSLACVVRSVTYIVCSLTYALQNSISLHTALQNRVARCREFFLPPTFSHTLVVFFMPVFFGESTVINSKAVGDGARAVQGDFPLFCLIYLRWVAKIKSCAILFDNVPNFVKPVTGAYKQTFLSIRQTRVRSDRWMQCEARSRANQGEWAGVYYRTWLRKRPQICQEIARNAPPQER